MKTILFFAAFILTTNSSFAGCTPSGDEITYGTNNVWIGYAYGGIAFDRYKGWVNEGSTSSASFDESFGGAVVNYPTNGCTLLTDTFSIRYKLNKTFADGDYIFTVGGDDGYRFSLDGGLTWSVNAWSDHGYTATTYNIHLNGNYNLVIEYYENFVDNRISFDVTKACTGSGNPAFYGTNNQWIGYVYAGMNFDAYKGYVSEGSALSANFDESFGGDNVTYSTSDCSINTNQFSVRYRLKNIFANGTYTITVGADDGYRLSLDGGNTYIIDKWGDQSYSSTTYTATLNGAYNLVLDYYENGGGNRVSFTLSGGATLPITLTNFKGVLNEVGQVDLTWTTMMENDVAAFEIQRSGDGLRFDAIDSVKSKMTITTNDFQLNYNFTDTRALNGISYYRVRVLGKDGKMSLTPVTRINNDQSEMVKDARIYPTLVRDNQIFVESHKYLPTARIEFFDIAGNKISETALGNLNGRQQVSVSRSGPLKTGIYVAHLTTNGQAVKTELLMIQN